jgi:hypothetical protein
MWTQALLSSELFFIHFFLAYCCSSLKSWQAILSMTIQCISMGGAHVKNLLTSCAIVILVGHTLQTIVFTCQSSESLFASVWVGQCWRDHFLLQSRTLLESHLHPLDLNVWPIYIYLFASLVALRLVWDGWIHDWGVHWALSWRASKAL